MTSTAAIPVVLLEGPPGCSRAEVERLRASGARIVDGLRAPAHPMGSVCVGVVDGEAAAVAALLAVLAGSGLVVEARADRAVVDRLVDDLRRRGPVDHRVVGSSADGSAGARWVPEISVEARAILGMLAMGLSLGEAAHVLGLARRTADRRLSEARRALGVTRTTEAIASARRLGWLDRARDRPIVTRSARRG
jgi:DNA-binding NarL/FixJ family response regulator